jgi:hypothetical protein
MSAKRHLNLKDQLAVLERAYRDWAMRDEGLDPDNLTPQQRNSFLRKREEALENEAEAE